MTKPTKKTTPKKAPTKRKPVKRTQAQIDNPPPIKKPIYTDSELFQAKVNEYFEICDATVIKKQVVAGGKVIIIKTPEPYTMAGLAYHLDIERQTLNNYKKRDSYFDIIMCARKRIEKANISLAMVGCHDSKIAALNLASNYGYAVKSDISVEDTTKPKRPDRDVEALQEAGKVIAEALKGLK